MTINIINLRKRPDRKELVITQMEREGVEYRFWEGFDSHSPMVNISKSHKLIVAIAQVQGWANVCIAEDDLVWTAPGAWKYFLNNTPADFDLYVSSYYSGSHDENFVVSNLRGLTLYILHSRFFDKFLSLPESTHIDGAIALSGAKVVVSPLFCAIQRAGYSDQRKRWADDSLRIANKSIFTG